jgi:hypothetical protein
MFKKHLSNASKFVIGAFFSIVVTCFFSAYALAQEVSQEGADKIKDFFSKKIQQTTDIQKFAGDTYEWEGDVSVEPSGNYYAITLPYLKIKQIDGKKLDIGMIAINAIPYDDKGNWKTAVAIPTPIRIYDKLGALDYKLDIGKQRMHGIFIANAGQFLKLDGQVQDVVMTNAEDKVVMRLPQAHLKYDFNVVGENIWDGTYIFKAENIDFNMEAEQVSGKIASVYFEGMGEGLRVDTIQDLQDKMQEAAQGFDPQNANDPTQNQESLKSLTGLGDAMFSYLADFGDKSGGTFGITGLSISVPDMMNPGQKQNFNIEKLAFEVMLDEMRTNKASLLYGIQLLGINFPMDAASPFASFGSYFPKDIAVKFKLADVPYKDLLDSGNTAIKQAFEMSTGAGTAPATMPDFKKLFLESNAKLLLQDTYISNDLYRITTDVNMMPAPNSPYMAKGTALTKIYGLPELAAKIQQDAQSNPQLAAAAQPLAMMQMFGQQKEEDGKKVFVYDLQLQEGGQVLLNGTDLMQMMGGGMPPQ